jgi:hypothetical protein
VENTRTLNRNLETIAWGAFFIWWGITGLSNFLPHGTGAIGIGLIWLGLNAARALKGIPISSLTTTLGILALVLGGLELASSAVHLSFELPVFALLLVMLGVILLARELIANK